MRPEYKRLLQAAHSKCLHSMKEAFEAVHALGIPRSDSELFAVAFALGVRSMCDGR